MTNQKFLKLFFVALLSVVFVQCNRNDEDSPTPSTRESKDTWVIYNGQADWSGGIYTFQGKPDGEVSLDGKPFHQLAYSAGGRTFGNHLYRLDAYVNKGLSKLRLEDNATISDAGLLSTVNNTYETNYLVVSDSEGYYWDLSRGGLKIQTFNPATMQRTGEIDLSSLSEGEPYEAVGQLILAKRDNKLYMDVQIGERQAGLWQVVPKRKEVAIAVYNLSTQQLEGVTTFQGTTHLSLFSDHPLWSIDAVTGDLYMVAVGDMKNQSQMYSSKILRIKKGENQFDTNFILDINDYQFPAEFNRIFAHNGKVYTTIPSRAVSYYGGGQHGVKYRADVWQWTEIDAQTKHKKILDIPVDNYTCYQNPFLYKGKIFFISNNVMDGFSGLSSYDPTNGKTKIEFQLKESGRLMGVNVIQK
ncbi:hypothetical protein [Bergeyella zoohelcum]|uniref:hypothetical protein n=1 Tax=Bergeyella zoohelcum TaxID=1015 RepID=UPI002A912E9B|nr:hypothetical protein [Bergeyella zoohelcum]MDY6026527.1 hypothetical protein [Bergeyella zoohelcum]